MQEAVEATTGQSPAGIGDYAAIARVDHWFKNVFMLPGCALAILLSDTAVSLDLLGKILVGILATSLIASANYTINEWLDAEFDRQHPTKKHRPAAAKTMSGSLVLTQWCVLAIAGLGLGAAISMYFLIFAAALLIMGIIYNVRPFRSKERPYLDVLSESINNPLRFMLGWAAVTSAILPPSSILIAYWFGGAYLMTVKRYAEYRFIGDPSRAALYRRSFEFYSESSLLLSAVFYAISSSLFLGVFLVKYRIEFLLLFPFLAVLFVWYLWIGLKADSVTQRPEKLYKETWFVGYVALVGVVTALLLFVDLPWMEVLMDPHILKSS